MSEALKSLQKDQLDIINSSCNYTISNKNSETCSFKKRKIFCKNNIYNSIIYYKNALLIIIIFLILIIFLITKLNINFWKREKLEPINKAIKKMIYKPTNIIFENSNYTNKNEIVENYIKNELSFISSKYEKEKIEEQKILREYISLKNISDSEKYKNQILKNICNYFGKNSTTIKNIFINKNIAFGNTIICLNNVIFYCEILGCKNIYLSSFYNWYIKNKITFNNITIDINNPNDINCNSSEFLCTTFVMGFWLNQMFIESQIRTDVLKNEIKRNLPKVNIDPNDLYIHIRSGDIFVNNPNPSYSQPPLCFYQKILYNFKFNNIYLISEDTKNPIISKLLEEFPSIIYKNNNLELDFSYLSNAYNLVGSVSSFLLTSIKFNDNLQKYWEYDIYQMSHKFLLLHPQIYKEDKKYITYLMKPSLRYRNEMFIWKNNISQIDLMLKEKCDNKFLIYKNLN